MNDEHHETILPSRHDALKTIAIDCKLLKVEQKWKTKEKEKKKKNTCQFLKPFAPEQSLVVASMKTLSSKSA